MLRLVFKIVFVSGTLLLLSSNSFAHDFMLCNRAYQNIISFQTESAGARHNYSNNWLHNSLRPGACTRAWFKNDDHDCNIRHKVIFQDGFTSRGSLNICRARQLTIHDDGSATFLWR